MIFDDCCFPRRAAFIFKSLVFISVHKEKWQMKCKIFRIERSERHVNNFWPTKAFSLTIRRGIFFRILFQLAKCKYDQIRCGCEFQVNCCVFNMVVRLWNSKIRAVWTNDTAGALLTDWHYISIIRTLSEYNGPLPISLTHFAGGLCVTTDIRMAEEVGESFQFHAIVATASLSLSFAVNFWKMWQKGFHQLTADWSVLMWAGEYSIMWRNDHDGTF